jgi:hypothetical protein
MHPVRSKHKTTQVTDQIANSVCTDHRWSKIPRFWALDSINSTTAVSKLICTDHYVKYEEQKMYQDFITREGLYLNR